MSADAPEVKTRADVYYPVLERAVSQLTSNTREARQALYERARRAHAAQLDGRQSELEIKRERFALEMAIRRVEEEASPTSPLATPGI